MNQNNLFVPIQMKLFMLKSDFDCTSENGIVMHNMFDRHIKRFQKSINSHRFDICHYPDNFANVSVHFNENGYTPSDFSFAPIDKVEAEWPRLLKETY